MKDLANLQRQFSQALHYQPFSMPNLKGRGSEEALLQIYRNQFVVSLKESMDRIYPAVKMLAGEECFDGVTRHHVLTTPMTDARVETYGFGFDNTLSSLPNIHEPAPYLADMAGFEWQFLMVSQRDYNAPLFPIEALSKLTPEQIGELSLITAPNIGWHRSLFCIRSLWEAVKADDRDVISQLRIEQPEQTLMKKTLAGVEIIPLSDEALRFIELSQQQTLGALPPELMPQLRHLVQLGVFSGFSLTSPAQHKENNDE
ncbi:DNA-binding domain-containing protein [Veronia pacifica]|uniref:HvfC/BufC N-terminal domain-containing protein n=1 Tax=Veronia pacifica TaxID=1080227 RepID=UPI0009F36768|nr:DNA-binding domain-containing protein [Veronia pacifica]